MQTKAPAPLHWGRFSKPQPDVRGLRRPEKQGHLYFPVPAGCGPPPPLTGLQAAREPGPAATICREGAAIFDPDWGGGAVATGRFIGCNLFPPAPTVGAKRWARSHGGTNELISIPHHPGLPATGLPRVLNECEVPSVLAHAGIPPIDRAKADSSLWPARL